MNRPAAPPYARHSAWVAWCTPRAVERRARAIDSRLTLFALAAWQVLAACERGLGFGIPHSHLNHLNSMQEVVRYFHWRVEEVAQHGQGPAWALPQLGSCASPGRARRLGAAWAARCSQGEAGPLGARHGLEGSSSPPPGPPISPPFKAADFTAIFFSSFFFLVTTQVARRKTEHDAHWTLNLPANVRLQGVPEKKLRALDAWEVNDAGEGKDAPRQVEP